MSQRSSRPDWQLPPGVSRGVWDYVQNEQLARKYDANLAGTPLLQLDRTFVLRHCSPPGRLIDLGCGTGRVAVPLAAQGYEVVGVDLSGEMLRVTQDRAAAANVSIQLVQANLVDLRCLADRSFTYAVCLFSTLGMISGANHRRHFLEHVHRLLLPGGRFVLHVHNWWFNLWDRSGRWWLLADVWRHLRGHPLAGDRAMPAHQGQTGFALHHFKRGEILHELRTVGFRVIEVQPVSLRADGKVTAGWWLGGLRPYGYLIAAGLNG